ncbi:hypothetical protein GF337_20200, partial [candidate division KSB1 bacterium]|nr:hypothetical protein [candidate division KSB1 bacterium]
MFKRRELFLLIFLCMLHNILAQTSDSILRGTRGINQNSMLKSNATMGLLSPSASFRGEMRRERVGYYMDGIGDINADGCEDFLIGTFHNSTLGYDAGACYLILGNKSNVWGLNTSLSNSDARFLGKPYDALGYWVSGCGDLNNDGYDDMIIGAPAGNDKGGLKPGETYIIFGKQNPDWGYDFIPEDQADASYIGEHTFDHCGQSLSIIGDMNGDGYDDFIVGSPYNDDGGREAGKVHLILGRPTGWSRDIPISEAVASFVGPDSLGLAGYSCSRAGDVNGDNIPDFIIGAPDDREVGKHAGKVYLIFGRSQTDWGVNFNLANADVQLLAEKANDQAGWSISDAGDVNGDGYDDFVIGAWGSNGGGNIKSGKVYLILGKSNWDTTISLSNADASFCGEYSWENAGWSVSGVKDFNEDGYDEILIGAWHNKAAGDDAGKMYVIYGKASGWQKNVWLGNIRDYFTGENPGDYAGYCVAGADMNGDGLGDILTSSTYNSENGEWSGEVYLFLSNRTFFNISGNVLYYSNNLPVPSVDLKVQGNINTSVATDENGHYDVRLYNGDYMFSSSKETGTDVDDFSILAYDAALTAQAAIKLISLSPEQLIAANADCDTGVTMFDAMLVAHYVAGLTKPSDSHVAEWTFNPEYKQYNDLDSDFLEEDYTGIIIGNVNGFWQSTESVHKIYNISHLLNLDGLNEGDCISIPCLIEWENQEIISADIDVEYNQQIFKYVGFDKDELAEEMNLVENDQPGHLRICMFGTKPINKSGILGNIHFEAITTYSKESTININRYQLNDYLPQKTSLNISFRGGVVEKRSF